MLTLAVSVSGCGGDTGESSKKITVLAAASLTEAFGELGEIYETENPGSEVTFSFAGSSELAAQINSGAPADVFASADEPGMQVVVEAGMVDGEPEDFASNVLEIAVPDGNPGGIEDLADLARKDLKVAVCAPEVPCGNATRTLFDATGIEGSIDTYEADVKAVLTKVELGEVDAGLVYRSDVLAAGDTIESITIPDAAKATNTYPIALLKEGGNQADAQAFIDLVLSGAGQEQLERAGFEGP
ncbi:MAG: molybdate ABC transporter substrate-binding protein [Solirubrobacterales bacterium]